MDEKTLEIVSKAKIADAILIHLLPIIDEHSRSIIEKIKSFYRAGKLDPSKIHSYLGELCALEDLALNLRGRLNKAKSIREGLNDNGDHI